MEEMLRENKMRKQREIREAIKRQERQNKKELILAIIIGLFIITLSVMCIANLNNESYKNCMEKNNNENMCMEVYE